MENKIKYNGSTYFKKNGEWLKQFVDDSDGNKLNIEISKLVKTMLKNEIGFEIINEKLSKKLDKKLRKLKLKKLNENEMT